MKRTRNKTWTFSRQINLSVVIQLVLLASMILTSYINLQCRLDLLQHDMTRLLQNHEQLQQKLEILSEKSYSYDYRLQTLENTIAKYNQNSISLFNSDLKGQNQ